MGGAAGVGGVEGVGRGAFYNLGAASCDTNAVSSNHASSDLPDRFGAIDII
jgi:hypothetical protein